MNFITLSEGQIITEYANYRVNHILISIANPGHIVNIPKTPYCKNILRVNFDDVEDISDKYRYFDMGLAEDILTFVNKNIDKAGTIIVHCQAGISRSVAVASALSKIINNADDNIFNTGVPNMLVYTCMLEKFFSELKIRQKYNKIYYLRSESLKKMLSPALYRFSEYKITRREKEIGE